MHYLIFVHLHKHVCIYTKVKVHEVFATNSTLLPDQTTKELETEQKFQDGMLTKMSKITDLMSRLDTLNHGDDAARVGKL